MLSGEQIVPLFIRNGVAVSPVLIGQGVAGSGGIVPVMIAVVPPNLGNVDFKIGVDQALGGAQAHVVLSHSPPVNGVLTSDELHGSFALRGAGAAEGFGTFHWPVPDDASLLGETVFMQWLIDDPAAPDGQARTRIAQLRVFCTTCPCEGDVDGNGVVDLADLTVLLANFGREGAGDLDADGDVDLSDLALLLTRFGLNCA